MTRTTSSRFPALVSTALAPLVCGEPRPVTVLAGFPKAVYLTVDDDPALIALVTVDGVAHPNALVLNVPSTARALAGSRTGQRGEVGRGGLLLGGLDVRVARWWDPCPRLARGATDRLRARCAVTSRRMREVAGPTPTALTVPLTALLAGLERYDLAAARAAADRLLGLGPGLTPAGDDVLAGLLAGVLTLHPSVDDLGQVGHVDHVGHVGHVRDLGRDVAAAAVGRTTSVSAALLAHAAEGRLATPAADLLRAWTSPPAPGDIDRVRRATDRLLAVGSSSGRDLTVGLLAAVELVSAQLRPDPSTAPLPTLSGRPN